MFKNYFFILFLLTTFFCSSQERTYIFGQLVDSTQNEPVPFASIRIKGKTLGVITNIDGTFKIPLRYKALGETIEISCMGYSSKEILIEELSEDQGNIIVLKPEGFKLNEVVVSANIKKLSTKQIVRIAVNSIPQNYPAENFNIIGYYRDYQVKNGNYTNLSEAIVKVEDEGFGTKHILDNQYQLYSYSQNPNFEMDLFAKQPYDYEGFNKVVPNAKMKNDGGNEFITLRMHDAIRNYGLESFSFVDDISSDFIDNHRFRLTGKTNYGKETIYEINLVYRNDDYRAAGKIFINANDFAIHKLDYAVFKRKQPGDNGISVNEKERFTNGFKTMNSEMLYHIQIAYARGTHKSMYLNFISFYNKVLIQRPAPFKSKFVLNLNDTSFRVRLNKIPAQRDRIRKKDFKITYKDQILPLEDFYFLEDERTFVVCPNIKNKESKASIDSIFNENDSLQVSDIKYSYGAIKDSLGNKLDERRWEYIHQYREFFTQEIQPEGGMKDNGRLMINTLPLDSPLQPISGQEMKNEYWKNSPLPTLKN
ncbi:MAG: carboxypeptidase-like regulatory domain-containing protein [Maribacter sp.]|nr:carboxypeptidase-like regulatory domain-containing protein [Maribacter sp.]